LRELAGKPHGPIADEIPGDCIVVARNMGAAELLDYSRENLRGLVLEEGTPTSHVVIVARALGIPVVGQVGNIVSLAESGNAVIVDGDDGIVHLRPAPDVETAYAEKVRFRARRQAEFDELRELPAQTIDGQNVQLSINAGLAMDLPQLEQSGADGIGLFRTELQFMVASHFPRPNEQEDLYREIMNAASGRPVTFRTLDIGGDKVLPYGQVIHEENPSLGWRAIRLSIDRPGLIRMQIRSLMKAAAGRNLQVMLPMVTEVREVQAVRKIIDREVEILTRFGYQLPKILKLGAMIEVPSLMWQLDELLARVDFVSVGSNDLFQFVMASDRSNPRIANRFDPLSRAFLRVLQKVVQKADEHGKPVTLCGEMAGRPLAAMALIGLGYRSLSMAPSSIGPIKAMVRALDAQKLAELVQSQIGKPAGEQTMREILADFADQYGVPC
ncbi:MAG: phosphoenolpyruvate--protein phosphotransferase, partial [Rhizobiaceae bacterium]